MSFLKLGRWRCIDVLSTIRNRVSKSGATPVAKSLKQGARKVVPFPTYKFQRSVDDRRIFQNLGSGKGHRNC